MMCTHCMSNYYLCGFLEIIDNKKIEENDETYNEEICYKELWWVRKMI
jgi:hypothetical protein